MSEYRKDVAEKMATAIESGTAPWQKESKPGEVNFVPFNPTSGTNFQGINSLVLQLEADKKGYNDPRWLTAKQAKSLGATVLENEEGTAIEYWDWNSKGPVLDDDGNPKLDKDGKVITETIRLSQPKVFYATVFNAEQISGLEEFKAPAIKKSVKKAEKLIESAGIEIDKSLDHSSVYVGKEHSDGSDVIFMQDKSEYSDEYSYLSTVLSQVAHSTRDESRLNRPWKAPLWNLEALRVNIATATLTNELGIGNRLEHVMKHEFPDSSELAKHIREDHNEIFRAARDADQIVAWITGTPEKRLELQNQAAKVAESKATTKEVDMKLDERHYINVSYDDRNEAKAVGAKWDRNAKSWYVAKDSDLNLVAKWDKPAPTPENGVSPLQEFGNFIRQQGLKLDGDPVMDGEWHRVQLEGQDGQKNKGGSYKGYLDGKPNGLVQNFRDGDTTPAKWVATGVEINANERAALKEQWEKRKHDRETELSEQREEAAKKAFGVFANNSWARQDNCPYLKKKGIKSYGVKQFEDGKVLIPARDIDGKIHSIQFVTESEKTFLKGSRKEGCFHKIDPNKSLGDGPIIVAEGYATGASIHEATGRPVIIAFDSNNLVPVTAALRGRHPKAEIVIAADDDHKLEAKGLENAGLKKAAKAAEVSGGHVLPVKLNNELKAKGLSDFDDLRQEAGLAEVKKQVEDGIKASRIAKKDKGTGAELSMTG
jgi:phage/plasmid primase-like uncharacterized protein/antirestriction protein ArdC